MKSLILNTIHLFVDVHCSLNQRCFEQYLYYNLHFFTMFAKAVNAYPHTMIVGLHNFHDVRMNLIKNL